MNHRIPLAAAYFGAALIVFASPIFAQGTPPPNGRPQGSSTVSICHYDSNDGLIHLEVVQPDQAPDDRGTATEGHDTLAEHNVCQQTQQSTPVPATPVPPVPAAVVQATPTATGVPESATATPTPIATVAVEQSTATPTAAPTWTPEATETPLPLVPEPTPPPGPLPACTPEQPQGTPCGGKG